MIRKITNGYELAAAVIEDYEKDAINIFFQLTKGRENKWLELKAGLVGKLSATEKNDKLINKNFHVKEHLSHSLYKPALSFINQDGGVILYGLTDQEGNNDKSGSWPLVDTSRTHKDYRFDKNKTEDRIVDDIKIKCLNIPYLRKKGIVGINGFETDDLENLLKHIVIKTPIPYRIGTVLPILVRKRSDHQKCILLRKNRTIFSCGLPLQDNLLKLDPKIKNQYSNNTFSNNQNECIYRSKQEIKIVEEYILYRRSIHDTGNNDLKQIDNVLDILDFKEIPTDESYYHLMWTKVQIIAKNIRKTKNNVKLAIKVIWNGERSMASISVDQNHPKVKEITKFLNRSCGWQVARRKYIEEIIPGLERICERGSCPSP